MRKTILLLSSILISQLVQAQNASISIGENNQIAAFDSSFVIGTSNQINGNYSIVLGRYLNSSADAAFVMGSGINNASPLLNSIDNSLMIGFNSDTPTLTVTGGDGNSGSYGRIGIGTSVPSYLLDIKSSNPDGDPLLNLSNSDESQQLLLFAGRSSDPNPFIAVNENSPLRFAGVGSEFKEYMRLTPDTLLGIGTFPSYTLDAYGGIRSGNNGKDGQFILYSEQGATDYEYFIVPSAAATQDVILTLPSDDGNAGDLLATDGSGQLSWSSPTGFSDGNAININGGAVNLGGTLNISNTPLRGTGNAMIEISSSATPLDTKAGLLLRMFDTGVSDQYEIISLKNDATANSGQSDFVMRKLYSTAGGNLSFLKFDDNSNSLWLNADKTNANPFGDVVVRNGNFGVGAIDAEYPIDALGAIRSGGEGVDGQLRVYSEQGATDYEYVILPSAAATQNVTLTLPPNDGNSGDLLQTNGSGVLSWRAVFTPWVDNYAEDLFSRRLVTLGETRQFVGLGPIADFGEQGQGKMHIMNWTDDWGVPDQIYPALVLDNATEDTPQPGYGVGLLFKSPDEALNREEYASINMVIQEVSDGAERGALQFNVRQLGSGLVPALELNYDQTANFYGGINTNGNPIVNSSYLEAATDIRHDGDADTRITFDTDQMSLLAGNKAFLSIQNTTQDIINIGNNSDTDTDITLNGGQVFVRGSDGYVGIGRNSPIGSSIFDVQSPTSGAGLYGGSYVNTVGTQSRPFWGYATAGTTRAWTYVDGNDAYKWKLNVAGSDRVTVDVNGNMGIRTTSPDYPLHVVSTGGSNYGIYSDVTIFGTSTIAAGRFIAVETSSSTWGAYGVWGTATNNGGTGIAIGVYGTSNAGSSSGTRYGVYASGDLAYTGALIPLSDRKFKTDIATIRNSLGLIMSLNPRTYHFKTDEFPTMNLSPGIQYGLIAQEVEEIIPDIISENTYIGNPDDPNDDVHYKGLEYTKLIPIIIGAVQEQQDIIHTLESKIDEQENEIEKLKAQLELTSNSQSEIEALKAELDEIRSLIHASSGKQ